MSKVLHLQQKQRSHPASRSNKEWLDILSRKPAHVLESGLLVLSDCDSRGPKTQGRRYRERAQR